MIIIYAIALFFGGLFAPQATIFDAMACPMVWGEDIAVCAVEFADHIPVIGAWVQNTLRTIYLQSRYEFYNSPQGDESILDWQTYACYKRNDVTIMQWGKDCIECIERPFCGILA